MRRIKSVFAVLTVVVAALIAFPGPAMADHEDEDIEVIDVGAFECLVEVDDGDVNVEFCALDDADFDDLDGDDVAEDVFFDV